MTSKTKKSVFITGCSSGIGWQTALTLQQRGFHVVASVRNPDDVKKLQAHNIECIALDLSSEQSVRDAVDYLKQSHANLYAVVNNGAYGQPGALEDVSRAVLRAQFETNVFGTHELTTQLLPVLRQQPEARIVQISSVLGFVALPLRGAYTASKFALEGLTDTLRLELRNTNIQVILIEPGAIDTRFRANALINFEKHISVQQSHYVDDYQLARQRLTNPQPARFAASADRVADDIYHALTAKRPRLRYRITLPTILIAKLKRLLSTRMLDKILSNDG